jgi:hypothetical protein
MLARRLIATAAITAGLGIGAATTAQAAPAPSTSAGTVRPAFSTWEDKGLYPTLHDCQMAGSVYVAMHWAHSYYCAPMTDNQHHELSIEHVWW